MEITPTGITADRLADISQDQKDDVVNNYGSGHVTTVDNPMIVALEINAANLSTIEEQMLLLYWSRFPSSAEGNALDEVASITGHTRQIAVATPAPSMLAGTPGTIIPSGSIVSQTQTNIQFSLKDAVTLNSLAHSSVLTLTQAAGTATCTTTAVHGLTTGEYAFVTDADQSEYNGVHLITVTSTTEFTFDVDVAAVSPATGSMSVKIGTLGTFDATATGPTSALAGSIITIESTKAGWDHIENHIDATPGRDVETDSEFRSRRLLTLAKLGAGTPEAIKATLLDVAGVSKASIFENVTGDIVNGRPPRVIEAFVTGGADTDVAQGLFDSRSAGIQTYGSSGPFPIIDSDGNSHDFYFSRLTTILVHVYMKITKNADSGEGPLYPGDGDDQIRVNIIAYGDSLEGGYDAFASQIQVAIGTVPGADVVELYIVKSTGTLPGDVANPGNLIDPISIGVTEIADFESTKIWINGTPGA